MWSGVRPVTWDLSDAFLSTLRGIQDRETGRTAPTPVVVIDNELQQERVRTASLEQRAMAVVTSSGILVSPVFGFGVVIKGQGAPHLPAAARVLLASALLAFVVAAVMSLLTNRPRDYKPLGVKADPAENGHRSLDHFG